MPGCAGITNAYIRKLHSVTISILKVSMCIFNIIANKRMEVIRMLTSLSQRKPFLTHDIRNIVAFPSMIGSITEQQRLIDVDLMVANFERLMKQRGQDVAADDLTYAYHTLYAWHRTETMTRPVVIAAPCGFGKTTLLEVFVRYMTRTYPDNFGCIVIKDKREEVRRFVDDINRAGKYVFKRYAYGIYGFRPEEMRFEEYRAQFIEQVNYPVVVMTKEMWARQSNVRNVNQFLTFRLSDGEVQRRVQLLIDERPYLISTYDFTATNLSKLIEDVRKVSHEIYGTDASYYADFERHVQLLRVQLESYREESRLRENMHPVNRSYTLPTALRQDWAAVYDGENYDALGLFESAIQRGGLLSVAGGKAKLTVSYRVFYEWGAYNAFILDATAAHDPHYLSYDFAMFLPEQKHMYDNVTFYANHNYNLSKDFFRKSEESFERVADMVRDIAGRNRKTMLATYKENLPKLESLLAEEIQAGQILTKYFDTGRASNDYRDCDCAVFIGWLLKGDSFYPSIASAIYGETYDFTSRVDKERGFHFIDETVDDIRFKDMVTERVQDIHRLRPRSTDEPISIHILHRDRKLIDEIVSVFPGAKVCEFHPLKKLSGEITAADRLIEYFREMQPGQRTKKKVIRDALGVHRNTFTGLEKDGRVIEAMNRYGVTKEGTFYKKRK
jgi:hypothetical protein